MEEWHLLVVLSDLRTNCKAAGIQQGDVGVPVPTARAQNQARMGSPSGYGCAGPCGAYGTRTGSPEPSGLAPGTSLEVSGSEVGSPGHPGSPASTRRRT